MNPSRGANVLEQSVADIDPSVEKLVLVSDLHAFRDPLEILDRNLDAEGDHAQVLSVGDVVTEGLDPVETVTWVRRRAGGLAVRGNHDRGAARPGRGDESPDSEPGAGRALGPELLGYLTGLPDCLLVRWRGKKLRLLHGDISPAGQAFSYASTPEEGVAAFGDPSVDAVIYGHTHYPFVRERKGSVVANAGSTSMPMLQVIWEDGRVHWQSGDPDCPSNRDARGNYLRVTESGGRLEFEVVRFDCDRKPALRRLADAPRLQAPFESLATVLRTGVFDVRISQRL